MRTIPLVLIAALALARPAAAAAEQTAPRPAPEAAERVTQADRLIRKGSFDDALSKFIDPTIAEFEKEYSNRTERIYCARDSAETLYYLAQAAAKREPAVVLSYAYAYAYFLKAYILVDRNQFDAAIPVLTKATELSPQNAQYLSELGHIYQSRKDWQKSLDFFVRAAEAARRFSGDTNKSEDLRRALRGQGYSLVELGRLREAEKLYHQCLEINADDATAKGELGYIEELRLKNPPKQ